MHVLFFWRFVLALGQAVVRADLFVLGGCWTDGAVALHAVVVVDVGARLAGGRHGVCRCVVHVWRTSLLDLVMF